jgi:hypothetical protein
MEQNFMKRVRKAKLPKAKRVISRKGIKKVLAELYAMPAEAQVRIRSNMRQEINGLRQQLREKEAALEDKLKLIRLKDAQLNQQHNIAENLRNNEAYLAQKLNSVSHTARVNEEKYRFYQELLHKTVDVHANMQVCRSETIDVLIKETRDLRNQNSCNMGGAAVQELSGATPHIHQKYETKEVAK